MKTKSLNGRELGQDLARFLTSSGSWMVWTQLPLGSVWYDRPGVVDVLAVLKSWTGMSVKIYEVKTSRSDFLADVTKGKYERYLDCCTQFYFAAPTGLIQKTELPQGCGLITFSDDKGWHVVKAGAWRDFQWKENVLFKLLIRGFDEHFPTMRSLARRQFENDRDLLSLAKGRGAELAERLRGAEAYIKGIEELKDRIDSELGQSNEGFTQSIWTLRGEVNELLAKRLYSEGAVELASITMDLFNARYLARGSAARRLREIANKLEPEGK